MEELQRPPPIVGVERKSAKNSIGVEWEGNGGGGGGVGGARGEMTAELGRETALEHH